MCEALKPVEFSAPRLQRGLHSLPDWLSRKLFSRTPSSAQEGVQLQHSSSAAWPAMRCYTAPAHRCSCWENPQAQVLQNHLRSPLKTGARAKLPACLLRSCSSEGLSEISVGKDLTKLRALAGLSVFFYPFWYPFWLSLCHNAVCYWCISIQQAEKYWHYSMLFLDSLEWDCLSKLPRPFSSM